MLFFCKKNLNTLLIKYNIIKNLMNRKKRSGDINNKFKMYKDDKIIYKSSHHLHYLISLSNLKYLKKYAKMWKNVEFDFNNIIMCYYIYVIISQYLLSQ